MERCRWHSPGHGTLGMQSCGSCSLYPCHSHDLLQGAVLFLWPDSTVWPTQCSRLVPFTVLCPHVRFKGSLAKYLPERSSHLLTFRSVEQTVLCSTVVHELFATWSWPSYSHHGFLSWLLSFIFISRSTQDRAPTSQHAERHPHRCPGKFLQL